MSTFTAFSVDALVLRDADDGLGVEQVRDHCKCARVQVIVDTARLLRHLRTDEGFGFVDPASLFFNALHDFDHVWTRLKFVVAADPLRGEAMRRG